MNTRMALWLLWFALLTWTWQWPLQGADAPDKTSGALRLGESSAAFRFGFVGDGIARFQFLTIDENGQPKESSDAPHLVPQRWLEKPVEMRSLPTTRVTLTHGAAQLMFDPAKWTVRLEMPGASQSIRIDPASGSLTFPMEGPVFGLGEGGQPHDRRGSTNLMEAGGWTNPSFPLTDWGEHLGVPWLVSPAGWGIYIHQPAGSFNLASTNGVFAPRAPPRALDIFLVAAPEPAGLMRAWAEITGYPSLPPLWSLGYMQSHRELESREQIIEIAKTFREREFPCDTLIYLGTGFAPIGWNTGHGEFSFHPKSFPDPAGQLAELKRLHFHTVLHVTPRGENPPRRLAGSAAAPVPAGPYDPNVAAQYWARHAPLMKLGVDGWWPDEGEGAPPESRLARVQLYWDGPQMVYPDQRPFALHRTGAVGMQRYGGWLWSGDIKSTWKVLARQVPLGLNVSVGGTPYWGTDTGGFYQDQARELKGELFARWFQFSAFCPLFRSHGRDWRYRHLPWGFSDLPGPDRDERIEGICRRYLDLRYQLMPYTYSVFHAAHESGMPIMRPLWLHYPKDPRAVQCQDEYLWGPELLIAPVVQKGQTERKIYLPAGRWFDYWTGESLDGGKEVIRPVDLATMPIYARAGAILPHGPRENYTAEKPNDPLDIRVYPGSDGRFVMIEDDGETFSSAPMSVVFSWNDSKRNLSVTLAPGSPMRPPMTRRLKVEVVGQGFVTNAVFAGQPLSLEIH